MKETSDELSSLAARVLATGKATDEEIRQLAACVLSQDVTPGKRNDQPEETLRTKLIKWMDEPHQKHGEFALSYSQWGRLRTMLNMPDAEKQDAE